MAKFKLAKYEKHIELTNGRTRYYEGGSGDNHVIMVHGIGIVSSADSFRFVFEDMSKKYHCYSIDCLGFGMGVREVAGGQGPNFHMVVDHMREFMEAKGIDKASFIGHSAGGWYTGLLAYESPHLVNKLVWLGSAGLNSTVAFGIAMRSIPEPAQVDTITRARFVDWRTLPPEDEFQEMLGEINEILAQPGALNSLDPLLHQMHTPELRKHYLLHRRMAKIKVPMLIIWGEADYQDPWPTWSREYKQLNGDMTKSSKPWTPPNGEYVLMPAGHFMQWELPKETVAHITKFLDK